MDQALKDVLRRRPPSSLGRSISESGDPDTPTQPSASEYSTPGRALQAPRTPAFRPRTPSAAISTPTAASRPGSRPSLAAPRASLIGSTSTPSRRSSMSTSTSAVATPSYRRPESRASITAEPKWSPQVGDRVRLPSHGYEGTLRYLGPTHIRDGIWAGVELEGGFQGKGRNDGSVDGVKYFECAPMCGIFALADKLSPPTSERAAPSRPASVASQRSLTSSYSASGRVTPAGRRAVTPSFGSRSVSGRPRADDDPSLTPTAERRTQPLGNSTVSNAARAEAKITAGSRASKYLGMTAKQLEARTGTAPATTPAKSLAASTTTPRASKIGIGGVTPARGRPSIGGLTTPKPRAPRMSSATEMMPPPPSPQAKQQNHAAAELERELDELRRKNAELEDQLSNADALAEAQRQDAEDLRLDLERVKGEAEALEVQLATTNSSASEHRQRADELNQSGDKLKEELEAKIKELTEVQREMQLAAERASGELEAGIEAKRVEVRKVEERAEAAEFEAAEMKRLVDELTLAGNQIIELNESKQFTFECQIRDLQENLSKKDEEIETLKKADAATADKPSSPRAATAAEIDNETLTAQVKHLQNRIVSLEEQIDEARSQAESDSNAWQAKYNKTRDSERSGADDLAASKAEVARLNKEAEGATARIAELQGAVKENQSALEAARADIEALRGEATEAESLRIAAQQENKISELQAKVVQLAGHEVRARDLENKMSSLVNEIAKLKSHNTKTVDDSPMSPGSPDGGLNRSMSRRPRTSTGTIEEAEKSIRGYRHIVQEMTSENALLKSRHSDLEDEIAMLKEEIKLLQDINESDAPASSASSKELATALAEITRLQESIKELEREVSELESLVESKIYREDELETFLHKAQLERDNYKSKVKALEAAQAAASSAPNSRPVSIDLGAANGAGANGTNGAHSDTRCELCEGPHDLDACPVFSGSTLDGGGDKSPLAVKSKKWCADCESSAHDTADCPMADDVF
ncbi:hypothetical protein Q8F55_004829 [Vanrija albida]|uniref:CAP-Gly domain-containing protein n=1 Tax=Vanrija albida TaxID=181172 RepID=A0ABR3Q0F5_9TREE